MSLHEDFAASHRIKRVSSRQKMTRSVVGPPLEMVRENGSGVHISALQEAKEERGSRALRSKIFPHFVQYDMETMEGKIAVVTGPTSGVGRAVVKGLVQKRCKVILACRNVSKGQKTIDEISAELRVAGVPEATDLMVVLRLNNASFASVRRFASMFYEEFHSLDILCCNAGIGSGTAKEETMDGIEAFMGVNFLSHFLLTSLLLPALLRSPSQARVVLQNSQTHAWCWPRITFDEEGEAFAMGYLEGLFGCLNCCGLLNKFAEGSPEILYAQSKLALLLFQQEFNQRLPLWDVDDRVLIAVSCSPGTCDTGITEEYRSKFGGAYRSYLKICGQSAEDGATTMLFAATSQRISLTNSYVDPGDCGRPGNFGHPVIRQSFGNSTDLEAAHKLFETATKITGAEWPE